MLINIIVCILLLLPGCSRKPLSTRKEFAPIQDRTKSLLEIDIFEQESPEYCTYYHALKDKLTTGITYDEAVQLALLNSPQLQADFAELGLAKADLLQAGLLRNPHINSQFKFVKEKEFVDKIETNIIFSLSDLWQLSARKQVSRDKLDIVSLRISQSILDLYTHIKKSYNECLAAQALYANAQETVAWAQAWRNRIYYRQQFGFTSDLDKHLADTNVSQWDLEVIYYKKMVHNSYTHLRQLLGVRVTNTPIALVDTIKTELTLPSVDELEHDALAYRPEIQLVCAQLQESESIKTYEKKRFIKEADVGFSYERDFDNAHGRGFYIGLDIPIFDTNYAQIERANFLIQKRKKELIAQKNLVRSQLLHAYHNSQAAQEEIATYQSIVTSYENAIEFTDKYTGNMQLGLYVGLQTHVMYHNAKKMMLQSTHTLADALVDLERSIGKKLVT